MVHFSFYVYVYVYRSLLLCLCLCPCRSLFLLPSSLYLLSFTPLPYPPSSQSLSTPYCSHQSSIHLYSDTLSSFSSLFTPFLFFSIVLFFCLSPLHDNSTTSLCLRLSTCSFPDPTSFQISSFLIPLHTISR